MSDGEDRPEPKPHIDHLNLLVQGQDGEVVQFKIKPTTQFRKLMHAYCDRAKLALNTIRFSFDGQRVNETDTPKSMDMEDGDTIEIFQEQSGGGGGDRGGDDDDDDGDGGGAARDRGDRRECSRWPRPPTTTMVSATTAAAAAPRRRFQPKVS